MPSRSVPRFPYPYTTPVFLLGGGGPTGTDTTSLPANALTAQDGTPLTSPVDGQQLVGAS